MIPEAEGNLRALRDNPYPGRGIIVGMDESGGALVQVYWIMGRSANSRNRVFESEGGHVWTAAADASKVKDPSLIIYNAMRELKGLYVVTNGDQTDTIVQAALAGASMSQALNTRRYEPDAPNFTPRISAVCSLRDGVPVSELSILKKSALGAGCDRQTFRIEQFAKGYGHCITTYAGDGDPLPSFRGEPYILPLTGDIGGVARSIWAVLNPANRVSLAVKFIDLGNGASRLHIVNQYAKAQPPGHTGA